MRFPDPRDERRFVEGYTLDDVVRTQAAMVLGAFVYGIFSIWDWILDAQVWRITGAIRAVVILGVLLPLAAALFSRAGRRHAEAIYLAYCIVPGCLLSLIYRILEPGFDNAAAGMIIVILFVSTLLPLRTLPFVVFCAASWASFAWVEAFTLQARPGMHFVNNFYIANAVTLALYSVAAREIRARRQFRTTDELRREKERSDAALGALRDAQAQLVQAEKHAALGQLVAGVAHEVNTPIGLALTTATALDADVRGLAAQVETGRLLRSEMTRTLDRLHEGAGLVFANLSRAADLIHNFKQVAVDQANEERRAFALAEWLRNLMSTLGPLLRRKGHEVRIVCPDDLVLDSHPGALAQVISNLALNAMIHAYPDDRAGVMTLDVRPMPEGRLRLVFADDGTGIAPDHLPKVFDPFFTTKRDQGSTGLGLHIVFNLVVSTLQGRIAIEAVETGGTRFVIELPLVPEPAAA